MIKTVAINLGSTSTKIAYYEDDRCVIKESIRHSEEEIALSGDIWDQYDFRKSAIMKFLKENGIELSELTVFASRGGHTEPIEGGTYRINEAMTVQSRSGKYGVHIGNIGLQIAYDLSKEYSNITPTVTDLPTTDELNPLARYSGLKGIERTARLQALNHKAMARYYAESKGKRYEDMNLVVVMLGGGISVAAHQKGRVIDGVNGLDGDGCFSNNRTGGLPVGELVDLCFSGKYSYGEVKKMINGKGGLVSYLGTTDTIYIEKKASEGDVEYSEVLDAMCYQASKDIGAYATVLKGEVDAIILTGGMANSRYITEKIKERVGFIAPVAVLPGEREMESLALSAYRCMAGKDTLKEFIPKEI